MLTEKLMKWLSRDLPDRSSGNTAKKSLILSTDIGQLRKENQDRVACIKIGAGANRSKPFMVIALADGMGGMKDGKGCAVRTIAALFESLIRNRSLPGFHRLITAADDANRAVYEYAGSYGGSTLSALLLDENGAVYLNIGDSRIYAETTGDERKLKRVTIDDSLAEIVGGEGRGLLQFIGMGESIQLNSTPISDDFDRVLIASDGIHFIENGTLETIFTRSPDLSAAANRLNTIVRWSGAPDNASLAALSLSELKAQLINSTDSGIEIWDAFGDFYFSWMKEEIKPLLSPLVGDAPKPIKDVEKVKREIARIENREYEPIVRRITRKKKPTKKLKHPKDLQIVIDMGENNKGDKDDALE